MKTLKSSLDGHIDKVAMQWIEIKVSHTMNVFYIECRVMFKLVGMGVAIMSCIGCGT